VAVEPHQRGRAILEPEAQSPEGVGRKSAEAGRESGLAQVKVALAVWRRLGLLATAIPQLERVDLRACPYLDPRYLPVVQRARVAKRLTIVK
jgi:hypothetical protein